MSSPLQVLYPHRWKDGYHGPVTATLDWCEANYHFSHYIAELANSFSNLFTIWLALYGVVLSSREALPTRYTIGHTCFTLVGVGSFLFHATLLYEYQLGDEVPMIITATLTNWLVYDTSPGFSALSSKWYILSVCLFNILFTWSYYLYRNPVYHQMVFATLVFSVIIRVTYLLKWSPASVVIPRKAKTESGRLFATGASMFAFGFFIWNMDNIFCDPLTTWKLAIGWPAAFLLEGHSWWHILTAAGSYWMAIGIQYVSLAIKDDHRNYLITYASSGFPYVKRVNASAGSKKD